MLVEENQPGPKSLSSWWKTFKNTPPPAAEPATPPERPNLMRSYASSSAVPRAVQSAENWLFPRKPKGADGSEEANYGSEKYADPPIFGAPLDTVLQYAGVSISVLDKETGKDVVYGRVPVVVAKCAAFIKRDARDVPGLFRIPGSVKRIRLLQEVFSQPPDFGRSFDWEGYTPHDAANLLKRFLAALPGTLIPQSMYQQFREPMQTEFKALGDYLNAQATTMPKSSAVSEHSFGSQQLSQSPAQSSPRQSPRFASPLSSIESSPSMHNIPQLGPIPVLTSTSTSSGTDVSDANELNLSIQGQHHIPVVHKRLASSDSQLASPVDVSDQESQLRPQTPNSFSSAMTHFSADEQPTIIAVHESSPKPPQLSRISTPSSLQSAILPPPNLVAAAVEKYNNLIQSLPVSSCHLLVYILDLLAIIARDSDVNKMTASNLAAIFQPSILTVPEHDMDVKEYRLSQLVIMFLIENSAQILLKAQQRAFVEPSVPQLTVQSDDGKVSTVQPGVSFHGRKHSKSVSAAHAPVLVVEDDEKSSGFRNSIRSLIGRDASSPRSRSPDTRRQSWLPRFGSD